MLHFLQVVILDELSLSNDDIKKMKAGETTELEKTLAWLAGNTAMTLAALSSSSLLDRETSDALSQTEFDYMIARTGFAAARLHNIMRSSQNIAAATSTASVNAAQTYYNLQETISPGSSSTVPGNRPMAWLYKHTYGSPDYAKLAGFVTQHLRTVDTEQLKCVVLTSFNISPRQLSSEISRMQNNTPVKCYDAGVEMFDIDGIPKYREGGTGDGGEAELTAWLSAKGGVLVTSKMQFRGAEADSVIFITRAWGDNSRSRRRSPVTRAIAGLLMITSDKWLSVKKMRRDWEVEIVEEGVRESGSETEDSETEDSETENKDSETEDKDCETEDKDSETEDKDSETE